MKNKVIKSLSVISLTLVCCTIINAQDRITLTNGKELNAKVLEISDNEVKYKQETNLNGPTHVISKATIRLITYPNGSADSFESLKENSDVSNNYSTIVAKEHALNTTLPTKNSDDFMPEDPKKFSGPRVGLTFITNGTTADYINNEGKKPFITQFGWQFEKRIFTIENGTSGIVEFVPLVGGLEQGLFLPSANLLIGLRGGGKQAYEFALGPNLSVSGVGMVFAAGTNFNSGKVNFPVNIAVVPSVGSNKISYDALTGSELKQHVETGWRITLTVGFNSRKK